MEVTSLEQATATAQSFQMVDGMSIAMK